MSYRANPIVRIRHRHVISAIGMSNGGAARGVKKRNKAQPVPVSKGCLQRGRGGNQESGIPIWRGRFPVAGSLSLSSQTFFTACFTPTTNRLWRSRHEERLGVLSLSFSFISSLLSRSGGSANKTPRHGRDSEDAKPYIENVRVVSAPEGRACEFLIAFPQPTRHDYRIVFYRQRTTGEFAKWLFLKELSPSRVTRLSRGRDKTISDETLNVLSLRSRPRDISIVARGAFRPARSHVASHRAMVRRKSLARR